jgi:hypothetical protein
LQGVGRIIKKDHDTVFIELYKPRPTCIYN